MLNEKRFAMCIGAGCQKRDRLGAMCVVDGVALEEGCAFDYPGNKLVMTECAVVREVENNNLGVAGKWQMLKQAESKASVSDDGQLWSIGWQRVRVSCCVEVG